VSYGGWVHLNHDFVGRLARAAEAAARQDFDAILVTPGPDLRYLVGYDAVPLERLTCLVLPSSGDPVLVVPGLEELAALASPVGRIGMDIRTWSETDDPFALVASIVGTAAKVAVDNHMWAEKVLRLRAAMPAADQVLAGSAISSLRMRKDEMEVAALREAGQAIDGVHAQVPGLLRAGRTEREVGRDIAELILAAGHVSVDFVIVASGANGASPHHELSDRVLQPGDAVVVDIGGTMPSGYCSDSTRMYAVGEPPAGFMEWYRVLAEAQQAAVDAVRPGLSCEGVDAVARDRLADAGLADLFIHRTGHGIGLETHEEPYIVAGNGLALEPGMAFSIEPGFYDRGRFGARIEDIVVCTDSGAESMNHAIHDLVIVA
jgi:Xaa-Pro aminopeptidase